jgi:hypothetical protein
MAAVTQLTIDGGEVPYAYAAATRKQRPLTPLQADIIRLARLHGEVRSVEAGVLVHLHRGACGVGARSGPSREGSLACCGYTATDGSMACRRLMKRGLLQRHEEPGKRPKWKPTS